MMYARVHSFLIVSAALSCASQGASAQSPYSYPWCGTSGGGRECYYATLEQCIATTWGGRGGRCIQSPYYRPEATVATKRQAVAGARQEAAPPVADRAVARATRTASVRSVPEPRGTQTSSVALGTSDLVPGQDYATLVSSAERGDATAQYNLGVMYDTGRGVLQDYVLAHKWYNLAATRYATWEADVGASAARNRDHLTTKMTPAQVAEAQKMAREWEPKQGR